MRIAAALAGLRLETIRTITPSTWLHYQWLHLATYPSSGVPSTFWAGLTIGKRLETGKVVKIRTKAPGLMHQTKINHVLTRLRDVLNVGDNYIFILRKP